MIIPESTIQKIIDEADIVKVISDYIKLDKKSSNFVGLCPFHPDQNPSLHVSPSKKIFKCFSCGEAGNVIKFVEKFEKVSFPRAVQIVGEKCGIKVDVADSSNLQISTKYYKILEDSANFYHFLLENTVTGKEAKKYLYKRNLNDEIIKRFKIGVSTNDPDVLFKSLLANEHQPLDMIEAGVVRSTNPYSDVFRNRIMFPLDDINGRIVGFSARIYQDSQKGEPKYLNSSENKIFKKGNLLYNYSNASNHIRSKDCVYIFEGFMDVIAAYKCNIQNAVATMGTSISNSQINTLKKISNNIVLCYDGDQAGIDASKKAILQLLKAGFNVNSIILPFGYDPDEYLNEFGKDKLTNLLVNEQISGYDYLYETAKIGLDLSNLNNSKIFTKEIFTYLSYFNSNIITEKFIKKLSFDLNVSVESLLSDYQNEQKIKQPIRDIVNVEDTYFDNERVEKEEKKRHRKEKYNNASMHLLALSFISKEYCKKIYERLQHRFVNLNHYHMLARFHEEYKYSQHISENFENSITYLEEKELLEKIKEVAATISLDNSDDVEKMIEECVSTIFEYLNEQEYIDLFESAKQMENDLEKMTLIKDIIKNKKINIVIKKKE